MVVRAVEAMTTRLRTSLMTLDSGIDDSTILHQYCPLHWTHKLVTAST